MKIQENSDMPGKKTTFSNFGDLIFWSYSNLQMLHYAVTAGKQRFDKTCYMIRSKAYKAYKEGRWTIHDLLESNVAKIQHNDFCWYCGKQIEPQRLTRDHVFPQSKGGSNDMDNIIMVCKNCNSSKGDMDLFEWYKEIRHTWPPINVMAHYLKNIYQYAVEQDLLDKQLTELDSMELPFKWKYIPFDMPQPEDYVAQ